MEIGLIDNSMIVQNRYKFTTRSPRLCVGLLRHRVHRELDRIDRISMIGHRHTRTFRDMVPMSV